MLKKLLLLSIFGVLGVFTLISTTYAETNQLFKDIEATHRNVKAIQYLKDLNVFDGYADGSFHPNQSINRAELLKIVIEAQKIDLDKTIYKNCFPDVKNEWFAKYICYAKEQKWIKGYIDGTFKPNQNISKVEALKILIESHKLQEKLENDITDLPFSDTNNTEWYAKYLKYAVSSNLLEINTGKYLPASKIHRAKIAENLARLMLVIDNNTEIFSVDLFDLQKEENKEEPDNNQPICIKNEGDKHGWYYGEEFIKSDLNCTVNQIPECRFQESFSEGWFISTKDSLIELSDCHINDQAAPTCSEGRPESTPICLNIDVETSGWYQDNNLLLASDTCTNGEMAECMHEGKEVEGWYYSPKGLIKKTECSEDPSKHGWYFGDEFIKQDLMCIFGQEAECDKVQTDQEGWYPPFDNTFLDYARCSNNIAASEISTEDLLMKNQSTVPYCQNDGIKSPGWFLDGKLIYPNEDCIHDTFAVCMHKNTEDEGWYSGPRGLRLLDGSCTSHMEFTASACDDSIDAYDDEQLGVTNINWVDNVTLELTAIISLNCEENVSFGLHYRQEDNKLSLSYNAPACRDNCAKCNCAHEIKYRIKGIEKKDYDIKLLRIS